MQPPEEDRTVADLLALLATEDLSAQRRAVQEATRLGPRAAAAAPLLVQALHGSSLELRLEAATALVRMGSAAVPALLTALNDPNPDVRDAALLTLAPLGTSAQAAVPRLMALQAEEPENPLVVQALRAAQGSAAGPTLLPRLEDLLLPVLIVGMALVLGLLGQALIARVGGLVVTAAGTMAFLGLLLGVVAWSPERPSRVALLALLLGLGGAMAGLLIGGVLGGLVEPAKRVLDGP